MAKAVSPIIAIILLVAVTVSTVGMYFNYFQNMEKIVELPANIRIDNSGDLVATISSEAELKELEIRKSHLIGGEYTTKYGRVYLYKPVEYVTLEKNGQMLVVSTKQGGVISKIIPRGLYKILEYRPNDNRVAYTYLKWASWEGYEGLAEVVIVKTKEIQYQYREFKTIEEIKSCVTCKGFTFRYNEEKKVWASVLEQEEEVLYYKETAIKDNKIFILKNKNTTYIEKAR